MLDAQSHNRENSQAVGGQRRMLLGPLLAALIVALVCHQFYRQQMAIVQQDAERLCELRGRRIGSQIEHAINDRLSRADGLMRVVALDPQITSDEFSAYAERLLNDDVGLRNMGLVQGSIIRVVYPLEANEGVIGKDLLDVPEQAPAIRAMMDSGEPMLSGPVNLLQGGRAFVYRVPVMLPTADGNGNNRNNGNNGNGNRNRNEGNPSGRSRTYWGNVALVVDYDSLVQELESLVPDDLRASLSQQASNGRSVQWLIGKQHSDDDRQVEVRVDVPGVNWVLHLKPKAGWPQQLPDHLFRCLAGLFLSGLAALVTWMLLKSHLVQSQYVLQLQDAQRAMQLNQDRLQLALKHGNIGLWEWDNQSSLTKYSTTYRLMICDDCAFEESEIMEDWESRLHPQDRDTVCQTLQQFLHSNEDHYQAEYRLKCGDRVYRWFRAEASTTESADVGQRRVMGVLIDITEDREIRQRLQDERLEIQLILDSIPSLVILQDAFSKILRVNEAVVRATGLERKQLTGMAVDDVLPGSGDIQTSGESGIIRSDDDRSADVRLLADRWVQTQRIALHNSEGWTDRNIIVSTDITDLKVAEQQQVHANRFRAKVGELALVGGWDLDCVTNELTWSDQVKQIHEVAADYEPDISTAALFYQDEAREQIQRAVDRAIEDNVRWDIELPMVTAKGRQIYVRVVGQPVFENGRCMAIWGVLQDVTERHQENELRESLFRNAPNAYLLFNENGIIECNPAAIQMLEAEGREDLLGRHPAEFSPEYQPCGTPSSKKSEAMDALACERGVHRFEWTHQRLNGNLFPCEVTLSYIETNSSPSLLAAWRDLSGLKEAERERDSFFLLSPDLFCVVDDRGCFKRVNSAWNQVVGPGVDSLQGRRVADLPILEHRQSTEQMLQELVETGRVTAFHNQVEWVDGSIRWLEWNARESIHDQKVYFAVARDVTQQIQSEQQLSTLNQELNSSNSALRQSNVDLQQFVYVASHDLQSPLRGIAGFAQLLEDECAEQLGERGRGFLSRISNGTRRMRQLIQDLLKYSRIQVQSEEENFANLRPVSLNQVIDDILVLMQPELEETGAKVIREDLPEILGDTSQVSQLFSNLIGNAIKYNSSEIPEVHLKTVSTASNSGENSDEDSDAADSNCVKITVQDNGIGIEPEFRDQVFEVFRRLHTDQEYSGTGIGLAICKRVMQRHGGDIRIASESEFDSGTCFHLRFPLGSSRTAQAT